MDRCGNESTYILQAPLAKLLIKFMVTYQQSTTETVQPISRVAGLSYKSFQSIEIFIYAPVTTFSTVLKGGKKPEYSLCSFKSLVLRRLCFSICK